MIEKLIKNIKKIIKKVRIFKRLKEAESLIERFREETYGLKGQLMAKRKVIDRLNTELLKTVNELNLLGEKLDKVEGKKHRAELKIAEFVHRRDEFLNRLQSTPDVSITSFVDYKFWVSEPFIVEKFKTYIPKKSDIDGSSTMRGLGEIFKKIDEKKIS